MARAFEELQFDRESGEYIFSLRFSGGQNSIASPDEIDSRECTEGENFELEIDTDTLRPRKAVDLVGTAPNAAEVKGIIPFTDSNGVDTTLIQAGGTVYNFSPPSTFTQVGTVNSGSRLRGGRHSTSLLDDKVLISDLEKLTTVREWDGSTFGELTTNLGSDLFAAHILVEDERAYYGNVTVGTTEYPHVMMASSILSAIGTSTLGTLSTSVRPASGVGVGDAFFLPIPDLRTINAMLRAFGKIVFSVEDGPMWYLTGADSTDFAFAELFPDSGASGDEAVIHVGNDILYGRQGTIESLLGVQEFGDIQKDDPSRWIRDEITSVASWQAVYNPKTHKAYFWPKQGRELWRFSQALYDPLKKNQFLAQQSLSPWTKLKTELGTFQTQAATFVHRPDNGQEVIWFGGPDGQIYQMEGVGGSDGGSEDITVKRTSGMIKLPDQGIHSVRGYVLYKKSDALTLTLNFKFQGVALFEQTITVAIPAIEGALYWGESDNYWGESDNYWGTELFGANFERQNFKVAGRSTYLQVEATFTGATDVEVAEIGLRFKPGSSGG